MRDGYWAIRTYEAGPVGEKIKFWVPGQKPVGKLTRKQKSDIRKAAQNEYAATRQLARLINANFQPGDLFLGLDYSEEAHLRLEMAAFGGGQKRIATASLRTGLAMTDRNKSILTEGQRMEAIREAAAHELVNCIRRVKRELDREGIELKYVSITSDMDGETGEAVRVHHHLVINREAREAFLHKWQEKGMGGVDWKPLDKQDDYYGVAEYMVKQVRKQAEENQFASSRNLVRPKPKDRVVASAAEVRVPKGCRLLHRQEYKPGKAQYIRYRIEKDLKDSA